MDALSTIARAGRIAATGSALLLLTTACAGTPTPPNPAPAAAPGTGRTPGGVTIDESGVDLRITHAVAELNSSGTGRLTMVIDNAGGVPEHLDMIATPDTGRATLEGGRAVNGSMTSAGILIQPGSTIVLGSKDGPEALLHDVHGVTKDHTLPIRMEFGVAGLVSLQARVVTT